MDHWGLKFPLEYYSKAWPSVYFSAFCVITAATITIDYSDSVYTYGDDWWSKRYTRTQEVITYTGNRAEGISTPVKDS